VDAFVAEVLAGADDGVLALVELGLHHEQQHQELILTDILHAFSRNPLRPSYRATPRVVAGPAAAPPQRFLPYDGGLVEIGHTGPGFAYDNERPRHRTWVAPFSLAARPVTAGEYLEFVADGGYRRPELWMSAGWDTVCARGWTAPAYWSHEDGRWLELTLDGVQALDLAAAVVHVSWFEADAYARWAGARLPSEAEWEVAMREQPIAGNFVESGWLHPRVATATAGPAQAFGDVWEWTASAYDAYPGFRPTRGAVGEYNGKFMCNQFVLRGGSCATPASHIRATYRNFFPADARWQFSGIRLARDP
jgi:ergothioneine biosynthesis protein EgtB